MTSVGHVGCLPTDSASVGCVASRGEKGRRKKERSKTPAASEMATDPDSTSSSAVAKSHHKSNKSVMSGDLTPPVRTPSHARPPPPLPPGSMSSSNSSRPPGGAAACAAATAAASSSAGSRRNSLQLSRKSSVDMNGNSTAMPAVIDGSWRGIGGEDGGATSGGGGGRERSPPGEVRPKSVVAASAEPLSARNRSFWAGERLHPVEPQENGAMAALGVSDGGSGGDSAGGSASEGRPKVAGILYKWVNFGRGYRPRWFVLDKGVLYYYKVHGPEKVNISLEKMRRGELLTIGEEALKMERKEKQLSTTGFSTDLKKLAKAAQQQGLWGAATLATGMNAVSTASGMSSISGVESAEYTREFKTAKWQGQVHLQFANLRESQSDDKKFYICTGSKTMHLIAEGREDRAHWMEHLQIAKERFRSLDRRYPLGELDDSLKQTLESVRMTLLDASVAEDVVAKCEEMVKSEMMIWQMRLEQESSKRESLQKALRNLEVEKLELESTVVVGETLRKKSMPKRERSGRSRSMTIDTSEVFTPMEDGDGEGTPSSETDEEKGEGMLANGGADTSDEDNDEFFEAVGECDLSNYDDVLGCLGMGGNVECGNGDGDVFASGEERGGLSERADTGEQQWKRRRQRQQQQQQQQQQLIVSRWLKVEQTLPPCMDVVFVVVGWCSGVWSTPAGVHRQVDGDSSEMV
ncbi:hypothetical protein CBR_g79694 [Chara braunii]|uniref:PH domain-containing protein n=1 Tax=Chara braunii TaxID=69332 RepID=A0A388JKW6_CHABU|nr:hypothetical protein CBR_g79694 [Chara braunii]|eukprot:GBG46297.1 hypothetical protein CBR_g79694 [Chara braunii]